MNGYLVNFAIYTLAMIGFIVLALYIYKKTAYSQLYSKNQNYLNIENSIKLSPTKTVYVLKAGSERFLIAGDASTTTMLAKLDQNNIDNSLNEKDSENSRIQNIPSLKEIVKKINRG